MATARHSFSTELACRSRRKILDFLRGQPRHRYGRGVAAGLLAQVQCSNKVINLLRSQDREIRSEAADWAPVNSHVSENILDHFYRPAVARAKYGEQLPGRRTVPQDNYRFAEQCARAREGVACQAPCGNLGGPQLRGGLLELLGVRGDGRELQNFPRTIRGSSP